MVECLLRVLKVMGSNPISSNQFFFSLFFLQFLFHSFFEIQFSINFTDFFQFWFSVVYYRDSMLITTLLIFSTIVVRAMSTCSVHVPNWIENTTSYVGSNKFGQLLLTKHLIERVCVNLCHHFVNWFLSLMIFSTQFAANT